MEILGIYEQAFRQRLNMDKTSVHFSRNTKEAAKRFIMSSRGQGFKFLLNLPWSASSYRYIKKEGFLQHLR